MFNFLAAVLGDAVAFAYSIVPSYAAAIVLATLAVFVTLSPISALATYHQQRGRRGMERVKPDLDRLRQRHAGDPEMLRAETAALFAERGINPTSLLGGIALWLIQAPIFIAMFQTIRGLGHLAQGVPDPRFVPAESALHAAIVADNGRLLALGLDLAASPAANIAAGLGTAIPALMLLAALVGVGLMQVRRAGASGSQPKAMTAYAFLSPLVALSLPTGLGLYFLTSSAWRVAQLNLVERVTGA